MCIFPSGEKTDSARQTASELRPIFLKGRAVVTNFFQYVARLSQGIRANLAQWLERVANNRKVPGSNPGYAPSMGA